MVRVFVSVSKFAHLYFSLSLKTSENHNRHVYVSTFSHYPFKIVLKFVNLGLIVVVAC